LNSIETIATAPNTHIVPNQTRRYSSTPDPIMRREREPFIDSDASQATVMMAEIAR
jgi:hypothetical protein